jgi:hypothetical protein
VADFPDRSRLVVHRLHHHNHIRRVGRLGRAAERFDLVRTSIIQWDEQHWILIPLNQII